MTFESAVAALDNYKPAGGAPAPASPAPSTPAPTEGTPAALDPPTPAPGSPGAEGGTGTEKPESVSQAFQALTRAKKQQLEQSRKLKEREDQIAAREKRITETEGKPSEKPKDPIAALEAAGFSFSDASEFILNNSNLTPEQQIKALRVELEKIQTNQVEKDRKAEEDRKKHADNQRAEAVSTFKEEIGDFLTQNAETYELCAQEDPGEVKELVYEIIRQKLEADIEEQKTTGVKPRVLSVDEGMKLAEGFYEGRAEKYVKTKKMQSRFAPKPADDAPPVNAGTAPSSRTLANAPAAGSAGGDGPALTDDERFRRAMLAADRAVASRKGQG